MNWAWAASLDQLWRSPTFPMWLTLAAAGFFAVIMLITLLRADKSVANGALTVITLLAIGIASAATLRGFNPGAGSAPGDGQSARSSLALPALACLDDLAGDAVLAACEKALFGSPDAAAAAVSYTAARINTLTAIGDVASANRNMTAELQALRRAVERDRYGLVAYVLASRDRCQPGDCAAYKSLTDHNQIAGNMDERVYEGLVGRYASSWNAPTAPALASLPPTAPTGKPTNADFPSAASTPPVNIMTDAPPPLGAPPAVRSSAAPAAPAPAAAPARSPWPATQAATAATPPPPAAKKPAPPKARSAPPPPTQLAPPPGAPTPEPADQ